MNTLTLNEKFILARSLGTSNKITQVTIYNIPDDLNEMGKVDLMRIENQITDAQFLMGLEDTYSMDEIIIIQHKVYGALLKYMN